uniref:Uncharacterized protein n=1 Tax=Oryza rufipogon TaxID=4529 RepID=A0A0E0P5D5_ORYRU
MTFVVTKSSPSVLVRPSEPTPAATIRPTSTDMTRLGMSFTSIHVFERRVDEPAETIRRALSRALVHYYPFAGRLAGGSDDGHDVVFSCTGEGVAFVRATANCTLEDVNFLGAPVVMPLADLAVRYGGPCRAASDPLMMMQVTEFACGGFVVAATWNHGVADACGLAQFLRAVGELARGLPSPSVVPVRYDESLPDIPQLATILLKRLAAGVKFEHVDFAYCDVIIPWSFVNSVKAEFGSRHAGDRPCSVFEAVTAAMWQCRTRAINGHGSGGAALAPLVFAANVRKHVGAKDGYYGNCIMSQVVVATADAVANGDVVDLVKLIKEAKERIPVLLSTKTLGLDDDGDDDGGGELVAALCGYGVLYASSWAGLGLDGIDFGGGRPARVIPDSEVKMLPSISPCAPCSMKDGHGVNVVASCVTDEHLEGFRAQLARLQ